MEDLLKGVATEVVTDKALDWDDEISGDSERKHYLLLEEGDYKFTVKGIDRKMYTPRKGSKLPPCPQAVVHLEVFNAEETDSVEVTRNLFLCESQMWALSAFFTAIGLRKHGETVKGRWKDAVGCTGRVHIRQRAYNDKKYNEVAYFLDPATEPQEDNDAGFKAGMF